MNASSQRSTGRSDVDIQVTVNGIHSFHLLEVRAASLAPFGLRVLDSRIYFTEQGEQESETLVEAIEEGQVFRVAISVIGVYAQLPTKLDADLRYGKGPGIERVEYGVRFFPYTSSILRFNFELHKGRIRALQVNNGEEVRLLWSHASFRNEVGQEIPRQVAHSRTGWQEAMAWLTAEDRPHVFLLQLPVRASSRTIAKSILHPMFTWMASMVGITLAAELATSEVIVAAVIGTWSFLLREWSGSTRAHQINLLSGIFVFQATAAAIWGIALDQSVLWATIVGVSLAIFSLDLFIASVRFEYRGYLPRRFAVPWSWIARTLERLRARRRRKLKVTGFDYERTAAPLQIPRESRRK